MDDPENPLSEAHYQQIVKHLAALDVAQRAFDKAKRAGIAIPDQQGAIDAAREKLTRIKQVYFPNRA